ncbi:YdeI/OmpD-associated family protein [Inquilinus sp. KBS0705]|nr:YdeI/OmpD-associated family protein [Inquilinus sp. KBS0705]
MTPLAKKLLIKPGQRWLMLHAPESFLASLEPLPNGVSFSYHTVGSFNGVLLFVKNSKEFALGLTELKSILTDDTIFWVIYPKQNKGIETDLNMMSGWEQSKAHGLRPVAAVAVNDVWTTLRFRPEKLVKHSDSSVESIKKQNDYSAYINPEKKQVTLPDDVAAALSTAPTAMAAYQSLAWSNRKEYIVWILDAKQEKTRTDRMAKMVDKLLAGKKNPSEK